MLQPIGKKIIVKPIEAEKTSILITNKKPTRFQVIAIGDEVTKVKVIDVIYIDKYSGVEIEHEKETLHVIEESQILAKIS
jgi:co-chaperonin GroES (HSP10)